MSVSNSNYLEVTFLFEDYTTRKYKSENINFDETAFIQELETIDVDWEQDDNSIAFRKIFVSDEGAPYLKISEVKFVTIEEEDIYNG